MRAAKVLPVVEAFIVAAAIPALLVGLFAWSWSVFLVALMITSAHAVLLGLPLFLLLQMRGWVNVISAVAGGFLIGVLPVAAFTWPLRYPELQTSAWAGNYGQTMVDGVPTLAGWQQYFDAALFFGGFGASAGLAFWAYLWLRRRMSPSNLMQPTGQQRTAAD